MKPKAPHELWPNTTPRLMARIHADGDFRNDLIAGWARYHDDRTGLTTVEPVIVDPENERHLIFARECEEFTYIVDVGETSNDEVVEQLRKLNASLGRINSTLTEVNSSITM